MAEYYDDVTAVSTSTESINSKGEPEAGDRDLEPAGIGPLLEKGEQGVIKLVNGYWEDLEPAMAERIAHWKANRKRRQGVIGVHVVKPNPDKAEWKVWAPPGAAKVPPTFNQPARLSRRLVSNLFVDSPIPEATPGSASDNSDPDAAEFTTRILQDVCTSRHYNVPRIGEMCVSRAATYDSAFARVYVDPKGNGSRPKTIQASQQATTVEDALYQGGDGVTPQPTPYVTRYVTETDELTDDPASATLEWLPGIRHEILTGLNLRPIPASSTSIEDCSGVVIRTGVKLGKLRDQFPDELGELDAEELWELVKERPAKSDSSLEPNDRQIPSNKGEEGDPPPDDTTVVVSSVYMRDQGEYPAGAYVVIAGTKRVLHRQPWEAEVNGVKEALPLPIAQFKGWDEGESDFYGYHLMHFLGPGNEVRAAALGGAIEHMDRFNRRKVFYTPQSLFQPKIGPAQQGVMVPVQQGTAPQVEDVPEYPRVGMELFDRATAELNDESGLQPIAQGMADPSVQSGLHAQKVIEQVNIGLGGIKRSTDDGIERLWTIAVAFLRAYYTISQQIRYRGDDQEYKQKEWSATDLGDTKDVRILKGSFTMLAPSAKLAVAEYMRKLNLIDDNQLRSMAAGNIGGLMGLQDDPALLRIRRQISMWEEGPPKSESPAEFQPDAFPGQSSEPDPATLPQDPEGVAQEMAGEMSDPSVIGSIPPAVADVAAQPAPPPDPVQLAVQNIFKPAPNDKEPAIAQIRFRELSRAMCGKKYERQPDPWRQGFDAIYEAARKAAGVGTAEEAAANQAAAQKAEADKLAQEKAAEAQAAQQAQAAKAQADQMLAQAKAQSDQALAELKSQEAIQLAQLNNEHETELERMRLEHASVMKNAELDAAPGEPDQTEALALEREKSASDYSLKLQELELKKDQAEAELKQKTATAAAELKGRMEIEREKIAAEVKIESQRMEREAKQTAAQEKEKAATAKAESGKPAGQGVTIHNHIPAPGSKKVSVQRDKEGRAIGVDIESTPQPLEAEG